MATAEIEAKRNRLVEVNHLCWRMEERLGKLERALKDIGTALDALHVTEEEDAQFTDGIAVQIELQRAQLQGHRDNLRDEFARLNEEATAIESVKGVLCDCHGAMDCTAVA